jgi:hypothetical protein
MRHTGLLKTEPTSTRERVTSAVHYLMVERGVSVEELARVLGAKSTHYVQHRKLKENRWKIDDFDLLGEYFDVHPGEFAFGYRALAETETETHD